MNISELFSRSNVKIFKEIAKNPSHIRDIAEKLSISPTTISSFAQNNKEIIIEQEIKNRKHISLNKNNQTVQLIRSLLNYEDFINAKAYATLKKFGKIGVYGSYAAGTNDEGSDIDLWMMTDKKELELRPIIRELEKELNMKVSLLLLSKEKIKKLEENDYEFLLRLKITSRGDNIDF
jgi:predicted nucleotidyltransferase